MSKQYDWARVTDVTPYVESGDWADDSESSTITYRLYSPKGKKYPLLFIGVYGNVGHKINNTPITGIKISCSFKRKSENWWDEHDDNSLIPLELLSDVYEMLSEIKDKK